MSGAVGGSRIQAVNSGTFVQSGGVVRDFSIGFESNAGPRTHALSGGEGINIGASWAGGAAYYVTTGNTVNVDGSYFASINNAYVNPSGTVNSSFRMDGGVINFLPTWTGSLTQAAWAGSTTWIDALTQTGMLYNGSQVTSGNFDDHFQITNNGTTVSLVPEPAVIPFVGLACSLLLLRRRGGR